MSSLLNDKAASQDARDSLVAKLNPPVYDLPRFFQPPKPLRGSHSTFLQRAIDLAVANVTSGRGGPFGAVVVRDGHIVAEGTNLVTAGNDPSAHAEVMAIRAACAYENKLLLDDCTIYSSCEPCPMCLGAIHWARLSKLYFAATRQDAAEAGFDDSIIYDQLPLSPAQRSVPARQMLVRQGRAPLQRWMENPERLEY